MVSKPATEWSDGWCFTDIRDTSISCPTHLSISRLSFCPTRRRYGVPWIAFAILLLWLGNNSKKICASPKKSTSQCTMKRVATLRREFLQLYTHIAQHRTWCDTTLWCPFFLYQTKRVSSSADVVRRREGGKKLNGCEQLCCYQRNSRFVIISSLRKLRNSGIFIVPSKFFIH